MPSRGTSDECYVIDLCDDALGCKASRQHRFDFLLGDPSILSGRCARLPVDAYYREISLVVEFMERQHSEVVPFFDRRITGTGVARSEQRKIYDQRRATVLPLHGIRLVTISVSEFLQRQHKVLRNIESDRSTIKSRLRDFL